MLAVHFGAGNIGRGFIGLVLALSGFEVCFVDVNAALVDLLNERRAYTVTLAGGSCDTLTVRGVRAIHGANRARVARTIAEADLVTTAIGMANLEHIAKSVADGIVLRSRRPAGPLLVMACENGLHASSRLKEYVYRHLPADAQAYAEVMVSFPNAVVDRIVPNRHGGDPLHVLVEPFYEWTAERPPQNRPFPAVSGVRYVDRLDPYLERKLFTVNTGHCAAAYLGYVAGCATIQEAMGAPAVREAVAGALQETGALLVRKHGLDPAEQQRYVRTTLERFSNPHLPDSVARVGRSPVRKLAPDERLVAPAVQAYAHGITPIFLTRAIAAALRFDVAEDAEAQRVQACIRGGGAGRAIAAFTALPEGHPLHGMILRHYHDLAPAPSAAAPE